MRDNYTIEYHKLYEMYASEMFAYGMGFSIGKETVLDAIHDVFLHIIERKSNINLDVNAKFYLLVSLRNRLFSIKRKEITIQSLDDIDDNQFSLTVKNLEEVIEDEEERNELISQIESILNELTSRQREVIYLRYMQNLSYEEVAELLNITPKAARKLTYRALSRIKELYGIPGIIVLLLALNITNSSSF